MYFRFYKEHAVASWKDMLKKIYMYETLFALLHITNFLDDLNES